MEVKENPPVTKEIELIDIFTTPFLYHSTDPSNIESILIHGIISPGFYKRSAIGITFDTTSIVKKYKGVFLIDPSEKLPLDRVDIKDIVQRAGRTLHYKKRIAFLVDPKIKTEPELASPSQFKESLRYLRIRPQLLKGIVVDSFNEEDIERIKKLMSDIHKIYPTNSLPIYSSNGDLIWPKHMTNEEIKRSLEEKAKL